MKRKRIKRLVPGDNVNCFFCKENPTDMQLVGGYDFVPGGYAGGNSVCDKCYRKFQEKEKEWETRNHEETLGEELAYRAQRVF